MKKHIFIYSIAIIAGTALLLFDRFVLEKEIKGLLYGFHSAFFALGFGYLIESFIASKTNIKEIFQKKTIEIYEERIGEKVVSTTDQIIIYVLCILILMMLISL